MKKRNITIILTSGSGTRFRSEIPKQFLKVAGKRVVEHTLDCFQSHVAIDEIIIVTSREQTALIEEIVLRGSYSKVSKIVLGGETRQASSAAGIAAIQGDEHKVLVHDAVRPLLDHATINRCLLALDSFDCVDTVIPSTDTVVQMGDDECIARIPDRANLRLGQTPQGFRSGILRQAHHLAVGCTDIHVTDDCGLVLHFSLSPVKLVDGDINNIKITYPSDIYLADRVFQLRSRVADSRKSLKDLCGKTLVIFGGSRGIGKNMCDIAQAAGANVVTVSRATGVDVANEVAVRETLLKARKLFGKIDAVAASAGILSTGTLAGQDYATIDEQLLTNLRGSIVVAREAYDAMHETGGGSIALFTSSSYTRGRARYSVYSATKAAVVNLVQALSEEFAPFHVRINAINPERTATPMRIENFGNEPPDTLLDADTVATAALLTLLSQTSGEVVDVRR